MKRTEGAEHLPDFFQPLDKNYWAKNEKNEHNCALCLCTFVRMEPSERRRHHCRRCGLAICGSCCQNSKYISKQDLSNNKATDKICDRCDFQIANPLLDEWATTIKIRQQ